MSWFPRDLLGKTHELTRQTAPDMLVTETGLHYLSQYGEPVVCTGDLIKIIEDATWEVIVKFVPLELATLGVAGSYQHCAPTVAGQELRIVVQCRNGDDRRSFWTTQAMHADTGEVAMTLQHEICTVDRARHAARRRQVAAA